MAFDDGDEDYHSRYEQGPEDCTPMDDASCSGSCDDGTLMVSFKDGSEKEFKDVTQEDWDNV